MSPPERDGSNSVSAETDKREREIKQQERFVVAALAFCLYHDDEFRRNFQTKIGAVENKPVVFVEPDHWESCVDLLLVPNSEDRQDLYIFEAKVNGSLNGEPMSKQNPREEAFADETEGYGWKIHEYAKERYPGAQVHYCSLGWPIDKARIPARCQEFGFDYKSISWRKVARCEEGLSIRSFTSSLTKDFLQLLANFYLIPSSMINKIEPSNRASYAKSAAETLQVIKDLMTRLGLEEKCFKIDWKAQDGDWWLQAKVDHPRRPHRLLSPFQEELAGDAAHPLIWLGYEGSDLGDGREVQARVIWLCCSEERKKLLRDQLPGYDLEEEQDGSAHFVIVRSSETSSDEDWFVEVLEKAGFPRLG